MRWGQPRRAAGLGAVALLVAVSASACVSARLDLVIGSDGTVDGSLVLAVDQRVAQRLGGPDALEQRLAGTGGSLSAQPSSGSVTRHAYRSDGRVGVQYVLRDVPVQDFGVGSGGQGLTIRHVGDTFVVDGTLDLTTRAVGVEPGASSPGEVSVSVTFPGRVVDANGSVHGRTVTWQPAIGRRTQLHAVGEAGGRTGLSLLLAAVALAALVVTAGLVVLVRRAVRRRPQPPEPPGLEPDGGGGTR